MNKATVEVMPDIEDGGPQDKKEKKQHKKYVLGALKKQENNK